MRAAGGELMQAMRLWKLLRRVFEDPPAAFVFEISHAGIAFFRRGQPSEFGFQPLEPDVLAISPLQDNVVRPEALFQQVRALAPVNGKGRRRTAALILPDYCARVAVLDFDNFPSDRTEQLSLVQFRMKKSIPFGLDSARIGYHAQSGGGGGKRYEVVVAVTALEIEARYEAAFRAAGFQPGYVTTSSLASLNLLGGDGVGVMAKLSGDVLAVSVTEGQSLKLLRCVELPEVTPEEVMAVLYPTFAYVEDELGARPNSLLLCGFGEMDEAVREQSEAELQVAAEPLRSRLAVPDQTNAGLLGYLEGVGA